MLLATDPRLHLAFDLLAWAASALLLRQLFHWRLQFVAEKVAAVAAGRGYVAALVVGAIGGAWMLGSFNTILTETPHFSHSIAGALTGGIIGVEFYKRAYGIRESTGVIWVGPIALGIAVGRLGCLFAGLSDETYGTPTSWPWGLDFGDGIQRHPVQLYEAGSMLAFLAIYLAALARNARWATSDAFYVLVFVYGTQRFIWEFFKPYPRLIGPFDVFQLAAVAMITYAVVYGRANRRLADS